ncbi:MAG: zinc-finger domain-containing protein [Alphaproteobacteria bacterium]|nr:zinc-finger domain-containing protein [Alphaproteobacteria bacterium]TAD88108.1 MAG: zinc-finger domain-containing protein [Alphaproteobacteria bacterium]
MTMAQPTETITVDHVVVACDGAGGALGHPRVYLNIEKDGFVDCPYCGRRYQLDPNAPRGHHH